MSAARLFAEDDRSVALRKLAKLGYIFDWPGRLVARMSLAYDQPYAVIALMDPPSPVFTGPMGMNPLAVSCKKVYLEAERIRYRFPMQQTVIGRYGRLGPPWQRADAEIFAYANTPDDKRAFLAFCESANEGAAGRGW